MDQIHLRINCILKQFTWNDLNENKRVGSTNFCKSKRKVEIIASKRALIQEDDVSVEGI